MINKRTTSILSAALLLIAISFSSCKKDYTCTCYATGKIITKKSIYNQSTKKNAQEKCGNLSRSVSGVGGWCELD